MILLFAGLAVLGLISGCVSTNKLPPGTIILEDFEETPFFIGAFYGEGFEPFDWTGYSKLIVDMYNATDTELELAGAICSGSTWEWQESINFPLPAGLNKDITIDLKAGFWKSSLTSWENNGILLYMEDVKRLVFKILGPPGVEGSVFIDFIRLAE